MKKLFLIIIAGTGIAMLIWVLGLCVESNTETHWPTTKAKIISSLLVIDHLPKFFEFNADPIRWYGTEVQYKYEVSGGLYLSNRLGMQVSLTRSPKEALAIMNKYRKHHEAIVYYDPADPNRANLEPWNIGDIYFPLVTGALLTVVGLVLLFDQSLEIKAFGQDNYLRWGNAYQKQGQFVQALVQFNKIIEIYPYIAQGYKSRGLLYSQQRQWDDALADFNQAIAIDPTDASNYFNRAQVYLAKEQYDKASMDAEKALALGQYINPQFMAKIKKGL